eukprot:TRINITY_DN1810_c1_g2_i1.p1 TRINITY_DN1810_c1_g2~~TRINITY_DN1810_c1_g2_i1.p1  ORF type:complete len:546 (-),score=116.53 TRINITY_DN1810_c1_g2_i1:602-2239(-)
MSVCLRMCEKVPIVVILGCTGAGKSKLALELASKYNGEIISADAMQMYKGLDIITNKVTEEEQKIVKHHMIDVLDSTDEKTVVEFRNTALPIIENLMEEGKIPFICGGTNYYIESLLWKVLVDDDASIIQQNKRKSDNDTENPGKRMKNIPSSEDDPCEGDESRLDFDLDAMPDKDDGTIPLDVLWKKLKEVDAARTTQLVQSERRKIWRSLQVWRQHGVRHSDVLASQGEGSLGGGLRFPANRICIIEVWSEKEILNDRCNRRVDKMIERGMVQELIQFHQSYSQTRRMNAEGDIDYTKGIFQSIGFKEFHNYLLLSEEEKETERGKEEFQKGVEFLKIATRQYARRQAKWMRRRFTVNHREAPPVYRVDSSQPELWKEKCYDPASKILQAYLDGKLPEEAVPLERIDLDELDYQNNKQKFTCQLCQKEFKGRRQYEAHIEGRRHKKELSRKLMQEPAITLRLNNFPADRKAEVAKILKNTFNKPLNEILEILESSTGCTTDFCELTQVKPRSKAENLQKCLAKHGIVVDLVENKTILDAQIES